MSMTKRCPRVLVARNENAQYSQCLTYTWHWLSVSYLYGNIQNEYSPLPKVEQPIWSLLHEDVVQDLMVKPDRGATAVSSRNLFS